MNIFGSAEVELRRVQRAGMLEAALVEVSRVLRAHPGISSAELLHHLRHEADEATRRVESLVRTY